jgi:D-ribulokinase
MTAPIRRGESGDERYVVGVDVGTGSARAGIFDRAGRMVGAATHEIALFRASGSIVEQSSQEIWTAVCRVVREALTQSLRSRSRASASMRRARLSFSARAASRCR